MYILGAGMAGCLAGVINSDAIIMERASNKEEIPTHKALLRFRSEKIGKICGVAFDKVKVRKAIYYKGQEYRQPTLRLVNWYSKKVANGLYSRSILDLEDVERYIAPENFHEMLLNRCSGRIRYGCKVTGLSKEAITFDGLSQLDPGPDSSPMVYKTDLYEDRKEVPVISTLPMPVLCRITGIKHSVTFGQEKIDVIRFRLRNCNIYQTMYYPDPEKDTYRASILRDLLIIERMNNPNRPPAQDIGENQMVLGSLGLDTSDVLTMLEHSTQLGKISPIDENFRKETILNLTMKFGIYSLGRFSVWRNILLDDVYEDALKIRQFIDRPKYDVYLASFEKENV